MRVRVLVTNGRQTIDLIWLEHTGTDVYYGYVGEPEKTSYHATGKRHSKRHGEPRRDIQAHQPLRKFTGQLHLVAFGFPTAIVTTPAFPRYNGKKADAVLWLDARTLPEQVSVSLGLIEAGNLSEMLPVWNDEHVQTQSVHLITSTSPWIYLTVQALIKPTIPTSPAV